MHYSLIFTFAVAQDPSLEVKMYFMVYWKECWGGWGQEEEVWKWLELLAGIDALSAAVLLFYFKPIES